MFSRLFSKLILRQGYLANGPEGTPQGNHSIAKLLHNLSNDIQIARLSVESALEEPNEAAEHYEEIKERLENIGRGVSLLRSYFSEGKKRV